MANGHGGARSGAGRKAGQKNRLTKAKKATLSELAQAYTAEALETLADVMRNPAETGSARVAAANSLLDRAHGKPVQAVMGVEDDEAPPLSVMLTVRKAVADVRVTKPE